MHDMSPSRQRLEQGNPDWVDVRAMPQPSEADPPPSPSARRSAGWSRELMFNFVIPLVLLGVSGAVVFALGTVQPAQRPAPDLSLAGRLQALPTVRVQRVQSLAATGASLHLKAEGIVVPFRESKVAAEVSGQIVFKSDDCEAGNYVTKGQTLMRIDTTDYQLEVERLTRLKEQEYQSLQEVDQEMVNTKRLIVVAERDVELRQQELDRLTALASGFASRAEIDQAERGVLQARQQLVTLQNQVDLMQKRRVRLEAAEKLAATELRAAEINLERTEIKSPIDGVIVSEDADLNTFVSRGDPLVTIEDTSKVEVASSLRMDQLYWVLDQVAADIEPSSRGYDLPETPAIIEYEMSGRDGAVYRWEGKLISYDGIGMDAKTRTVPVRVVVENPRRYVDETGQVKQSTRPTALVRGMYVQIKLLVQPRTRLVVVPARALRPGNRVWQFQPDPSVLDVEPPADSGTNEKLLAGEIPPTPIDPFAAGEAEAAEGEAASVPFDESNWVAGRVLVRKWVTPVDTLDVELSSDPQVDADRFLSRSDPQHRMWVCEVRDQWIDDGSFVVVSPLGSLDGAGLDARAKASTVRLTEVQREADEVGDSGATKTATGQPQGESDQ
jgi:multidrug efflux pump subunit AcrA (membrane-fusion protein)